MLGNEAFSSALLYPLDDVMCNVHTMTDITITLTVFKGPVIIYRLERGGRRGGGGGGGVRGIFVATP